MSHIVYAVTCPGCLKRIHAPSEDKRRAAVLRHIRNCNVLRREASSLVPLDEVPTPQEPAP